MRNRINSALESAKSKLSDGSISFEDLPKDRNDNLWIEIRTECHLLLGELSALKNAVCQLPKCKLCISSVAIFYIRKKE